MMVVEKPPNWLAVSLGKQESPQPPDLGSDRVKDLVGRALLTPGAMTPSEVQELAASVISHLVKAKEE